MSIERPEIVKDEHLVYLDELRESSVTNMWRGGMYVGMEFGLSTEEQGVVLGYWMDSFEERHPDTDYHSTSVAV